MDTRGVVVLGGEVNLTEAQFGGGVLRLDGKRLLELRDAKPAVHARALSTAQHAYAQSSAAERLLLDQCLEGVGRANALASS